MLIERPISPTAGTKSDTMVHQADAKSKKILRKIPPQKMDSETKKTIQKFIAAISEENLEKAGKIFFSSILRNNKIPPNIQEAARGQYKQLAQKTGYWEDLTLELEATGNNIKRAAINIGKIGIKTVEEHPKESVIGAGLVIVAAIPSGALLVGAGIMVALAGCSANNPVASMPVQTRPIIPPISSAPIKSDMPEILAKLDTSGKTNNESNDDYNFVEKQINSGNIVLAKDDHGKTERKILSLLDGRTLSASFKKTILRIYLFARSMSKLDRKTAIDEVDAIYKQWKTESDKPGATTITVTIKGRDYSGIEKRLPSEKYINAEADLFEIQNLTEKGQLGDAESKAKIILADTTAKKDVKKQALFCLLDIKSRAASDYKNAINKVDTIYKAWRVSTDTVFSYEIDGVEYQGIGKINPTYDSYMLAHADISAVHNLLQKEDFDGAKAAALNILKGTNYEPFIKKQALFDLLVAKSRSTSDYKNAINQVDTIYKAWRASTDAVFSYAIDGETIQGIEKIDAANDSFLLAHADISAVQNLFQKEDFDGAKAAALNILKGTNYEPFIKKQALDTYLRSLITKDYDDEGLHRAAYKEAEPIAKGWYSQSAVSSIALVSVKIGQDDITGIGAIIKPEDNRMAELCDEIKYWNILYFGTPSDLLPILAE